MEALKDSIRRDGFLCPIIVRRKGRTKYEVLAGNHRWLAAQELGYKQIAAVVVKVDDNGAQRIALNTNTVHGEPTVELLAPFLADLNDDVLTQIYLEDKLLRDLKDFDSVLKERLDQLSVPDSIDNESVNSPLPDCVCPKCGKRHSSQRSPS